MFISLKKKKVLTWSLVQKHSNSSDWISAVLQSFINLLHLLQESSNPAQVCVSFYFILFSITKIQTCDFKCYPTGIKKKKEVCMSSLFELFECLHFSVSLDDLYHFYFNRTTLKSKNSLLLLSYSLVMCGFNRMIFFIVPL